MTFTITRGKGFWLEFPNGYSISVQWGPENYCEQRSYGADYDAPRSRDQWSSKTAEIAVFKREADGSDTMLRIDEYDSVIGYLTAGEVADWIARVSRGDVPVFATPNYVED